MSGGSSSVSSTIDFDGNEDIDLVPTFRLSREVTGTDNGRQSLDLRRPFTVQLSANASAVPSPAEERVMLK